MSDQTYYDPMDRDMGSRVTARQPLDRPAVSEGQPVGLPELPEPSSHNTGTGRGRFAYDVDQVADVQRDAYESGKRDAVAALTAAPDVWARVANALAAFVPTDPDGYAMVQRNATDAVLAALTDTPKEQQA